MRVCIEWYIVCKLCFYMGWMRLTEVTEVLQIYSNLKKIPLNVIGC